MADCVFCKLISGEIPSNPIHEDDDFVGFVDVNPQAPTHLLLCPRKHIETVLDLTDQDAELLGRMFLVANDLARKHGLADDGFRYVLNCKAAGGQSVYHIHLHILGGRQMRWPPG